MKKILVLGSTGMLGHILVSRLVESGKYNVKGTYFSHRFIDSDVFLDVTNKLAVEDYILKEKPDCVINCIGVLLQGSKSDPSNAIYINAYFPHQLSKLVGTYNGKVIHVSTDCVFSGKRGGYVETDFKDALDVYGQSKALGEVVTGTDLTMRTSIIGPELKSNGEGLLDWFLKQDGNTSGYTNAYWSGVTTLELANAIMVAMETDLCGLYHLVSPEKISKFNLLQLFKEVFNHTEVSISPYDKYSVDKSLLCTRTDFNYQVASYSDMLIKLRLWMADHKMYYEHYNKFIR